MTWTTYPRTPWQTVRNILTRVRIACNYVTWSIHYEGPLFALLRIAAKVPAVFGWDVISTPWFQQLAERQFDRRFGVSTAGTVPIAELDITEEQRGQAVEYTPTTGAKFGCLLAELPLNYQNCVFVDFGCGKGRSILMASEFPFRKIIGVELSAKLQHTAQENIARYRSRHQQCSEIYALLGNATAFEFPVEPLVLYFFNPFSAVIVDQVLANLAVSLQESPRDVLIIYYNPLHESLLADSTFLERFECKGWEEPKWALYRATFKSDSHLRPDRSLPVTLAARH